VLTDKGRIPLIAVAGASGVGGAAGSYVNQRMDGVAPEEVDWGAVAIDAAFSGVGGLISYGVADVGGPGAQTTKQILSQSGTKISNQFADDFATTTAIGLGTWLNSTKINYLNQKYEKVNYARRHPYAEEFQWNPGGLIR